MKQRSEVKTVAALVAAPLTANEQKMPSSFVVSREDTTALEKRMLLFRLSEAGTRIREEADLIRRTGFTDHGSRLLRILAEAVEEQHLALGGRSVSDGEPK
jgi:hypothetical protein